MFRKFMFQLQMLDYKYTYRWWLLITKRPNKRYPEVTK